MTALERMRLLLGVDNGNRDRDIVMYLDEALEFILGYTKRKTLPPELTGTWVRVAMVMYSRQGMEGLARITAGSTQRVAEAMPADIMRLLNGYRAAQLMRMYNCDVASGRWCP